MADILEFTEGDSLPKVEVTYTGVDVTGYTFRLLTNLEQGGNIIKTGTATDAVNGKFEFQYAVDELTAGIHDTQIEVTDTSSDVITFRGPRLEVVAKIGG